MRFVVFLAALLLSAFAAQAGFLVRIAPSLLTPPLIFPAKVVAAGGHVILWEVAALNPDCSSNGAVNFRILQAPEHGKISIRPAEVFPNYPWNNLRSVCNTRRVAGQRVTYTPSAGYSGADHVAFEAIYPAGAAFDTSIPIVVR